MKIPNGVRADLGTKIEEYVLSPQHREGRHKARVFQSVLGITTTNKQILIEGLRKAIEGSDDAQFQGNNGHGDVYVLRFPLATERGDTVILSAWIIKDGEDFPRLITCYIIEP